MSAEPKQTSLRQFHKVTDRHVLVLEADIDEHDIRELLHMSNLIRIAGNELATVMRKQYEQLLRTKQYRRLLLENQYLEMCKYHPSNISSFSLYCNDNHLLI